MVTFRSRKLKKSGMRLDWGGKREGISSMHKTSHTKLKFTSTITSASKYQIHVARTIAVLSLLEVLQTP